MSISQFKLLVLRNVHLNFPFLAESLIFVCMTVGMTILSSVWDPSHTVFNLFKLKVIVGPELTHIKRVF